MHRHQSPLLHAFVLLTLVTPSKYPIHFSCGNGARNHKAQLWIETVIDESIGFFGVLNPLIQERLEYTLRHKKLKVTCDSAGLNKNGSGADSGRRFLSSYQIRIRSEYLDLPLDNNVKNVFLHELLHFAKIDNLEPDAHSLVFKTNTATDDYVYSCAFAAYPTAWYSIDYTKAVETCRTARPALAQPQ